MAATVDLSGGWVRELDQYQANEGTYDDDDYRMEDSSRRALNSRGNASSRSSNRKAMMKSSAITPVARIAQPIPSTSMSDELQQEMKLLNWHKLANEAALKAAIIKTNKIKTEENRLASSLLQEETDEKRQRIQQLIEEEQLKPLQANATFFRTYEANEIVEERKIDRDVENHILHLKKLKESMIQREEMQRRRHKYKEGVAALGLGTSKSIPKGPTNQSVELGRTGSIGTKPQSEVIGSLDKLMELEKRIRQLEENGLGGEMENLEENQTHHSSPQQVESTKKRTTTTSTVKTKARAKPNVKSKPKTSLSKPTMASAARKRSLETKKAPTFLTSVPDIKIKKQQQLRRMTDRERRVFLKKEKELETKQKNQQQQVIIEQWMDKKKQASTQRKQITTHTKKVPIVPPSVIAPLRGAAAGKKSTTTHGQQLLDIRKGFEKRKEQIQKLPAVVHPTNRVMDVRTQAQDKRNNMKANTSKLPVLGSRMPPLNNQKPTPSTTLPQLPRYPSTNASTSLLRPTYPSPPPAARTRPAIPPFSRLHPR